MNTSNRTMATQEQIRLDEQIVRLQNNIRETSDAKATILQLKYHRNAYTPLLMLPNELLLEISLLVRETGRYILEWHSITQICRHWRTLVVDTSDFWTVPPEDSPEYALLALERSKNAPLVVHISRRYDIRTLPFLLQHMRRIQTLELIGMCDVMELAQSTLANLGTEASLLESLEVRHLAHRGCEHIFSVATFRPTSALRRLILGEIRFNWSEFPLSSLTTLSLMYVIVDPPLSGERFVDALGQMPLLNTLEICFCTFPLFDYPSDASRRRKLIFPDLMKLRIVHPSLTRRQCEAFLGQLELPRVQDLTIDWEVEEPDFEPNWRLESGIISQLSRTISSGNFRPFEELLLALDNFTFAEGTKSSWDAPVLQYGYASGTVPFSQHSVLENAAVLREVILPLSFRDMDNSGHFSTLVKVDLYNTLELDASHLTELFGFLPRLKVLGIAEYGFDLLTQALSVPIDHLLGQSLPFATIESLEWFCFGELGEGGEVVNDLDPDKFDRFCTCMMQRSERGLPNHSLKLIQCSITPEQRAALDTIFDSISDSMHGE